MIYMVHPHDQLNRGTVNTYNILAKLCPYIAIISFDGTTIEAGYIVLV